MVSIYFLFSFILFFCTIQIVTYQKPRRFYRRIFLSESISQSESLQLVLCNQVSKIQRELFYYHWEKKKKLQRFTLKSFLFSVDQQIYLPNCCNCIKVSSYKTDWCTILEAKAVTRLNTLFLIFQTSNSHKFSFHLKCGCGWLDDCGLQLCLKLHSE